jgi:hypothetical protein
MKSVWSLWLLLCVCTTDKFYLSVKQLLLGSGKQHLNSLSFYYKP